MPGHYGSMKPKGKKKKKKGTKKRGVIVAKKGLYANIHAKRSVLKLVAEKNEKTWK